MGSGETQTNSMVCGIPEADTDGLGSALARSPLPSRDDITSSPDLKVDSLVMSEVAMQLSDATPSPAPMPTGPLPGIAPTTVATMTVATSASMGSGRAGGARAVAGSGWVSLGSVEARVRNLPPPHETSSGETSSSGGSAWWRKTSSR